MKFESPAAKKLPDDHIEELTDADIQLEEEEEVTKVMKKPPMKTDEAVELSEEDIIEEREPGEAQEADLVKAFEIHGFKGLEVAGTLEKKDERKGKSEDRNQDNIIADPATGLVGVLDGLGGEGAGDLASKAAESAIPEQYKAALDRNKKLDTGSVVHAIVERQLMKYGAVDAAKAQENRVALTNMVEDAMTKDPNMGRKALALLESISAANAHVQETSGKTTACVGFVHETPSGERYAVLGNIGDSGAFKRRKNGEMVQLTQEDSLLNTLQRSGSLNPELYQKMKASPKEKFPIAVTLEIVKAMGGGEKDYEGLKGKEIPMSYQKLKASMDASLGASKAEASLSIRRLDPGDELILGTDGVIDKFEDPTTEETDLKELAADAGNGKTQTKRLDNLRAAAKRRTTYKKDDDIALISVRVPEKTK